MILVEIKKTIYTLLIVVILIGAALGLSEVAKKDVPNERITNFQECMDAGYPIMESYPRQCRTPEGQNFVEEIEEIDLPEENNEEPVVSGGCATAGCSRQLCVEASEAPNIVTTCEYRMEYACYRKSRCERQASGKCGWTETPEFKACLLAPPTL